MGKIVCQKLQRATLSRPQHYNKKVFFKKRSAGLFHDLTDNHKLDLSSEQIMLFRLPTMNRCDTDVCFNTQ